ncbi:MAG: hypothetical protein PUA62_03735 [Lachnospiraceae bacterium]|nr:hypothetical protein [Lachnospiraceae bacterium]
MAYAMGLVAGILFSVLLIALCYKLIFYNHGRGRKGPFREKEMYDERQLLARGAAYKAGYYSLIFYLLLVILINNADKNTNYITDLTLVIGVCISIGVFAVVCIIKDAYMSLYENAKRSILIMLILGFINIGLGVSGVLEGATEKKQYIMNFTAGIVILISCIVFIIKRLSDKDKEDEEDEEE